MCFTLRTVHVPNWHLSPAVQNVFPRLDARQSITPHFLQMGKARHSTGTSYHSNMACLQFSPVLESPGIVCHLPPHSFSDCPGIGQPFVHGFREEKYSFLEMFCV